MKLEQDFFSKNSSLPRQRIPHLNNPQSEKKRDYIKHAKISPNKQFLLLGSSKNHTDILLEATHYWSHFPLQMAKAEKSMQIDIPNLMPLSQVSVKSHAENYMQ